MSLTSSRLGPSFKMSVLMLVVVFAGSAALLYGGAHLVGIETKAVADTGGGDVVPGGPVNVTVIGRNSLFDVRTINASAGAEVTVVFENQDAGVLHNIHFFGNRNRTTTLAKSDVKPGPATDRVSFTAPAAPGLYPYICDVHPDTMVGNLNVVR